jgi:hypothetical protein
MLEFQMVVGRWSFMVSRRPFLACPEQSEGTGDRHCAVPAYHCHSEETF